MKAWGIWYQAEALRQRAELEQRSMQEVPRQAIREYFGCAWTAGSASIIRSSTMTSATCSRSRCCHPEALVGLIAEFGIPDELILMLAELNGFSDALSAWLRVARIRAQQRDPVVTKTLDLGRSGSLRQGSAVTGIYPLRTSGTTRRPPTRSRNVARRWILPAPSADLYSSVLPGAEQGWAPSSGHSVAAAGAGRDLLGEDPVTPAARSESVSSRPGCGTPCGPSRTRGRARRPARARPRAARIPRGAAARRPAGSAQPLVARRPGPRSSRGLPAGDAQELLRRGDGRTDGRDRHGDWNRAALVLFERQAPGSRPRLSPSRPSARGRS